MISTSPIKISCVIAATACPRPCAGSTTPSSSRARTRSAPRTRSRSADERRPARGGRRRDRRGRADHARGARRARLRRAEIVPVRLRALRRDASSRRRRRRAAARRTRSPASTSRSSRPAGAPRGSGRRGSRRPARSSSTTRAPGGWTRRCRSSSARSTRTRCAIERGIVANPNCTTMVIMLPLKALHDAFGLRDAGRDELPGGRRRRAEGDGRARRAGAAACTMRASMLVSDGADAIAAIEHSVHAAPLAYNVVPWLGSTRPRTATATRR